MTDHELEVHEPNPPSGPQFVGPANRVVGPANRVNIALPFASIRIEESSRDLAELALLVADLASALEESAPGAGLEELRERSRAIALKLR